MAERTIEDRLRDEYFQLLPEIRRVADYLEAEVRHSLLPVLVNLRKFEHLSVISRVKACDSAIDKFRRKQGEGATFDLDKIDTYTLTELNDLAGVRVLAFPVTRVNEANIVLQSRFGDWTSDHVEDKATGHILAYKYRGLCNASVKIKGEFQIVSSLVGLFWEVEHAALYKLDPELRGIVLLPEMKQRLNSVYSALRDFETTFETALSESELS